MINIHQKEVGREASFYFQLIENMALSIFSLLAIYPFPVKVNGLPHSLSAFLLKVLACLCCQAHHAVSICYWSTIFFSHASLCFVIKYSYGQPCCLYSALERTLPRYSIPFENSLFWCLTFFWNCSCSPNGSLFNIWTHFICLIWTRYLILNWTVRKFLTAADVIL